MNTTETNTNLVPCNFCDCRYDETAAEYRATDRTNGQLCLACQQSPLIKVNIAGDPETDMRVYPVDAAADEINEGFYWAYTEFNDEEYSRLKDEIDALPHASGNTIEQLRKSTDEAMAGLQAFYDRHHAFLCHGEFRTWPCTFALTLDFIP